MKKLFIFLFALSCINILSFAQEQPKHEFRASWMTTGYGLDWPRQKTADAQKVELQQKLDALVAGNHNAVCLQVRSFSDAIYKSSYEPWADCLTGTRGQDPGYDPLAFAIEEAHKRGLELHVWVNPFRVTPSGVLSTDDPVWKNAGQWIIKYNNSSFSGQIIDPGYPEARDYVHNVFMEIVNNYDIDGILMDDYFYAYGGTNNEDADSRSKHLYKVTDADKDNSYIDDWRRANVDSVVHRLYRDLQKTKPWVRFGMGTPGNWSNKATAGSYYGISLPATTAMESYDALYCNPVEWAKQGWVDYLNPQVYWSTTAKKGDYDILTPWWAKKICEHFSNKLPNGQKVHFFASQGACYAYDSDGMEGYNDGVAEIQRQIDVNRANLSSGYTGSVLFSTSSAILMRNELRESHFKYKALPPAMSWKSKTTLDAPTNLTVKDTVLIWEHPSAERFTIYCYPRETKNTSTKATSSTIPTQEELWASYKTASGLTGLGNLSEITAQETPCKVICTKLTATEVQKAFANTDWTWLKNYITKVQNSQKGNAVATSTVPELTDDLTTAAWRYAIAAFFLQTQYDAWPYSADFTTAGQSSAWGPAYLGEEEGSNDDSNTGNDNSENSDNNITSNTPAPEYLKTVVYGNSCRLDGWGDLSQYTIAVYSYDRYGVEHAAGYYEGTEIYEPKVAIYWELDGGTVDVTLPTFVTERYVLPIPTKEGYEFGGWYNTKAMRGKKITEIPAGWEGTLYAKWTETEQKPEIVWELNGGSIDEDLPTFVRETYVLPTPYKEDNDFDGWYSTADFQENTSLTEIPANWKGTLYAKWKPTTALHSISINEKMEVYDVMGRLVGTTLPSGTGIFLVKQGNNTYKIVL